MYQKKLCQIEKDLVAKMDYTNLSSALAIPLTSHLWATTQPLPDKQNKPDSLVSSPRWLQLMHMYYVHLDLEIAKTAVPL